MAAEIQIFGTKPAQGATHGATLGQKVSHLIPALTHFGRRALAKAQSAVTVLQTARMMAVLSNMSDHQLADIGITRAEIPKYAETLMADG